MLTAQRSTTMNGKLTMILVFFLLFLGKTEAKVTTGFLDSELNVAYLDQFYFGNDGDNVMDYEIRYPLDQCCYSLAAFDDSASHWTYIRPFEHRLTCENRLERVKNRNFMISLSTDSEVCENKTDDNGRQWLVCRGKLDFTNQDRPSWYFLHLTNCQHGPDIPGNHSGIRNVTYRLHMTNGDRGFHREFSANRKLILETDTGYFLGYLVLAFIGARYGMRLSKRRYLHLTYKLFYLSLLCQTTSLFLHSLGLFLYARSGTENIPLQDTAEMFSCLSCIVFVTILILISKGYSITRVHISLRGTWKMIILLTLFIAMYIMCFVYQQLLLDPRDILQKYYTKAAAGLICIRILVFLQLWYGVFFTLKDHPSKAPFYCAFIVFFGIWSLTEPVCTLLAVYHFPVLNSENVLNLISLTVTFCGHAYFIFLLRPNDSNKRFPFHLRTIKMGITEDDVEDPDHAYLPTDHAHHPTDRIECINETEEIARPPPSTSVNAPEHYETPVNFYAPKGGMGIFCVEKPKTEVSLLASEVTSDPSLNNKDPSTPYSQYELSPTINTVGLNKVDKDLSSVESVYEIGRTECVEEDPDHASHSTDCIEFVNETKEMLQPPSSSSSWVTVPEHYESPVVPFDAELPPVSAIVAEPSYEPPPAPTAPTTDPMTDEWTNRLDTTLAYDVTKPGQDFYAPKGGMGISCVEKPMTEASALASEVTSDPSLTIKDPSTPHPQNELLSLTIKTVCLSVVNKRLNKDINSDESLCQIGSTEGVGEDQDHASLPTDCIESVNETKEMLRTTSSTSVTVPEHCESPVVPFDAELPPISAPSYEPPPAPTAPTTDPMTNDWTNRLDTTLASDVTKPGQDSHAPKGGLGIFCNEKPKTEASAPASEVTSDPSLTIKDPSIPYSQYELSPTINKVDKDINSDESVYQVSPVSSSSILSAAAACAPGRVIETPLGPVVITPPVVFKPWYKDPEILRMLEESEDEEEPPEINDMDQEQTTQAWTLEKPDSGPTMTIDQTPRQRCELPPYPSNAPGCDMIFGCKELLQDRTPREPLASSTVPETSDGQLMIKSGNGDTLKIRRERRYPKPGSVGTKIQDSAPSVLAGNDAAKDIASEKKSKKRRLKKFLKMARKKRPKSQNPDQPSSTIPPVREA